MKQPSQEQLRFILEHAILAPSADNHHRITFEVAGTTIRICLAEGSLPLSGGYKRVLLFLSLGALAENLAITAGHCGFVAETRLSPHPESSNVAVQVVLQANDGDPDLLGSLIARRHTSRQLIFRGPPMNAVERAELDAAVGRHSTMQLLWFDEEPPRREMLRLMFRAETERFRNRLLHDELFSAIRFDVDWDSSVGEGLPPGSLGVEAPLRLFFASLRHWPVARLANAFGSHYVLGFRSCYLPCRLAPHLGLLATIGQGDDEAVFNAGRSFQRLWLTVTKHGRVLQPMPAAALYARESAVKEGIPESLRCELAATWQRLVPDATPLMLFRLGFAEQSRVVSGRRPLADYFPES